MQGRSNNGMYEVLEYESTLELKDRGGKRATFKKQEKVRYLQDNIIAYQDQAWGDGEILVNYRCTPDTPVDRYRSGCKTYIPSRLGWSILLLSALCGIEETWASSVVSVLAAYSRIDELSSRFQHLVA